MKLEKETRIDLRNQDLLFMSFHTDKGEEVHQIVFSKTVIVLNEEQMLRLRGC
jgi:hypothetical protein